MEVQFLLFVLGLFSSFALAFGLVSLLGILHPRGNAILEAGGRAMNDVASDDSISDLGASPRTSLLWFAATLWLTLFSHQFLIGYFSHLIGIPATAEDAWRLGALMFLVPCIGVSAIACCSPKK